MVASKITRLRELSSTGATGSDSLRGIKGKYLEDLVVAGPSQLDQVKSNHICPSPILFGNHGTAKSDRTVMTNIVIQARQE